MTLALAGLALAGCGGGAATGAKSPTNAASTTGTTQPAATTSVSPPTDHASADKALMTVDDLPPGWAQEPRYPEGLSCGSFKPFASATTIARSGRMHNNYSDVQETIGVFPTQAASDTAYRQLNSKQGELCFLRTMRHRIRLHSGTDGIGLRIDPLRTDLIDDLGPHARAVNYSASFTSEVGVARIHVDIVRAQAERSVAVLLLVSGFTFVDYEQAAALIIRRLGGTLS